MTPGRRWLRLAVALALGVSLALGALAAPQGPGTREVYGRSEAELGLYLGNELLATWRVPEARAVVDRLLADAPRSAPARALEGHVLFFEGRYAEARGRLQELGVKNAFADLVAATAEATKGFTSRRSEHFEVSWSHPKDELLAAAALETLEAARSALARELGFEPRGRVRLEIYPTVAAFTAVSTLTRKEVETSGTIGLCKFDRLMITSPRATLWGYRWRDTVSHEYVHLALYRLTAGTAPIWIHEGVAKHLEADWRGAAGELDPSSRALLAQRMKAGTLIPLEAMSPSVAKLPTAEDTAVAFAQVGTMMGFLEAEKGPGALRRLVEGVGRGLGDREALEAVWGGSFAGFEAAWRRWAETLPAEGEAAQLIALKLADTGKPEDEPGAIPDPQARDFARLGDMLRARGRGAAAAAEYGKAYARAPAAPGIASRYALTLLGEERWAEAGAVADAGLRLYPDLAVLWHRKGDAALALGDAPAATAAYRELIEINPFHLPARRGLLAAARTAGDAAEVSAQETALKVLEK